MRASLVQRLRHRERSRSVLYQRIPTIFGDLAIAHAAARQDPLEILEERYDRRSTIITSQIPVDKWHELIGDPTYADAILDRVVHDAHRINLTGHSLRRSRTTKPSKD